MKLSAQQAAMIARDVVLGVEARKNVGWDFCVFLSGENRHSKWRKYMGSQPL